jgi:hypothetical protein
MIEIAEVPLWMLGFETVERRNFLASPAPVTVSPKHCFRKVIRKYEKEE